MLQERVDEYKPEIRITAETVRAAAVDNMNEHDSASSELQYKQRYREYDIKIFGKKVIQLHYRGNADPHYSALWEYRL